MFKITSVYKAVSVAGCSGKKVMGNCVLLEKLWYVHVEYFHKLCWKHGPQCCSAWLLFPSFAVLLGGCVILANACPGDKDETWGPATVHASTIVLVPSLVLPSQPESLRCNTNKDVFFIELEGFGESCTSDQCWFSVLKLLLFNISLFKMF